MNTRKSALDDFEAEIQHELEQTFAAIRDKKHQINELIGERLQEEKLLQEFISRYQANFKEHDRLWSQLTNFRRKLRSDIDALLYGEEDSSSWQSSEKRGDQPLAPLSNERDLEDSRSYDTFPESENMQAAGKVALDWDKVAASAAPDSGRGPVESRTKANPKKVITDMFLWIYFERDTESDFRKERTQILNEMRDNALMDEVDVMMRLPFDTDDEAMWWASLPKVARKVENTRLAQQLQGLLASYPWLLDRLDGEESVAERLYRFKLWNSLLEKALPRAHRIAISRPHELYDEFQTWQRDQIDLDLYIETLREVKAKALKDLKAEVDALEAELNQLRANYDR